jgi:hypothetical protein
MKINFNDGLKGVFLENIGQLGSLKEIYLGENSFSGSISPSIQNVQELGVYAKLVFPSAASALTYLFIVKKS